MDLAYSVNGVPIRLNAERWYHITRTHIELAEYHDDCLQVIENPDLVLRGRRGSLRAVKGYGRNQFLMVIYREVSPDDGFVISAYFVSKFERRDILWRR
jgi:hypothetical protein